MIVNQRYAEHLGQSLTQLAFTEHSYQHFDELRARFDTAGPLYLEYELPDSAQDIEYTRLP